MQILKSDINVIALSALSDNYIWILASDKMNGIYVVDPGDSRPVLNWLNNKNDIIKDNINNKIILIFNLLNSDLIHFK